MWFHGVKAVFPTPEEAVETKRKELLLAAEEHLKKSESGLKKAKLEEAKFQVLTGTRVVVKK